MKVFYDCEFLEDGSTIELISIGMVREDGREYYAVNHNMPVRRIAKHDWLMANVVPSLPRLYGEERMALGRSNPLGLDWAHPAVRGRQQIANEVREFLKTTPDVELWAWYGAYDHIALCQLWGDMTKLPGCVPMWTNDLQQEIRRLDLDGAELPQQASGLHNALADARHNHGLAAALAAYENYADRWHDAYHEVAGTKQARR